MCYLTYATSSATMGGESRGVMQSTPALRKFTLSRWLKLVERAWSEGLVLEPHPTKPEIGLCLSQTKLRRDGELVTYIVNAYGCSCPARGDCKHRAMWLLQNPALIPLAVVHDDGSVVEPERSDDDVKTG